MGHRARQLQVATTALAREVADAATATAVVRVNLGSPGTPLLAIATRSSVIEPIANMTAQGEVCATG